MPLRQNGRGDKRMNKSLWSISAFLLAFSVVPLEAAVAVENQKQESVDLLPNSSNSILNQKLQLQDKKPVTDAGKKIAAEADAKVKRSAQEARQAEELRRQQDMQQIQRNEDIRRQEVQRVNQQITDIIKLNNDLRMTQAQQAEQIRQAGEQARIHQQILRDIENARNSQNIIRASQIEEVLRQEKIRLIREQTERNRQILEAERNRQLMESLRRSQQR